MSRARTQGRSRTTRTIAATVAAMLFLTGLPFTWAGGAPAAADFGAGQPARYNENINGDFLLIGNTVLRCGSSNSSCESSGTNNDSLNMTNNDPDGTGALFNGSSGSFTIPSGAVVDAAYLYWGGNFGSKGSSNKYYCNPSKDPVSLATADKSKANTVKLAVGTGAYSTITSDTLYTFPSGGLDQTPSTSSGAGSSGLVYEAVSDVSSRFETVAGATSINVRVADIQAAQGNNCHAGWALVLVYRFPANNCLDGDSDASKRNDYRNVAIYDGLLNQQEDSSDTTTTLSGFITTGTSSQTSALRLGAIAWEGDQFITGDRLRVKATSASGSGTAVDPAGSSGTGNFFDSGKQPNADHNSDTDNDPDSGAVIQLGYVNGRGDGHGIDAKTQPITVPGGTNSIDVRFQTDGDNYYPGGFALSSPIKCLLAMQKDQAVNGTAVARDNATSPNPAVKAGDEITYTVTGKASGDVVLSSTVLSDAIPPGTTYVANSGKWGTGNTAAVAAAGTSNATFSSGKVTASVGTLDPVGSNNSCASNKRCFAHLTFKVTVNAGLAAGTIVTNQATSTFTASGVSDIRENSNEVTDRVGPRLTVSKSIVNPAAGDPTSFNFSVACNGSPVTGSPFSLANGASRVITVPPGANCSVTETTSPNFTVGVTGDITTNGGNVTMNADKAVTFTNTRLFGRISVQKSVVPVTGDPVAAPTFNFSVACPGVTGYPRTLQLGGTGGTVSTPSDIPFGTSCTVTETPVAGWTTGAAVAVSVDAATKTATFTNTRQTGGLTINKSTIGGDGTFSFAVGCPGTAFDSTRSVTTVGGSGSITVTGLPAGLSCTVTETVPAGWTLTSGQPPAVATQAGTNVAVAFTNTRQSSDLVITKAISGQTAIPVSGTFSFTANCGSAGTFTRSITASDAANGTATVPGIPVGTTCSISESIPAGWTLDSAVTGNTNPRSITIGASGNVATFTNRRDVGTLTVRKTLTAEAGDTGSGTFAMSVVCNDVAVAGSPVSITVTAPETTGTAQVPNVPIGSRCVVTEQANPDFVQVTPAGGAPVVIASTKAADTAELVNRRRTGDLVIDKVFPADSLGDPEAEFTISWDCGPEPRRLTLKAGASHTVSGLPTGTACTVTETATPGYSSSTSPVDGTVTVAEGVNRVTVTNTRDSGTLELVKALVPATDDGRVDLRIDGEARATSVGNGGTTGAVRLPAGSHLVAEATADGSPTELSDYDTTLECTNASGVVPVGTDGSVLVAAGDAVRCTYTNRRKATIEVVKSLSPANDPGIFALTLDGPTVASGGDGTTSGAVVVPVGTHTVGETAGDADTDVSDYDTSIECSTNGGVAVPGATVQAAHGDRIRCLITNTRKQADLSITKTAVTTSTIPAGTATFSITVANAAGAGIARDVRVEDPLPTGTTYVSSSDDLCEPDGTSCDLGDLAAGASRTFTITHRVEGDADIDAVRNAATVTSPDDPESPGAEASVPVARLSVLKSAEQPWFSVVGSTIDYSYSVSNPGGIALTGVTVTDNKIPTSGIDCNGPAEGNGQPFTLAVGATLECRASTTVHAADVAAARIDNVATADSDQTEPTGDTWTVPLASLDIAKTLTSTGPFETGDELAYDLVVTNDGAVALTDVTVSDPAADDFDQATDCEPVAPVESLEPGGSIRCSATHTVTQGDVDAGEFTNTATASSTEIPLVTDEVTTPFTRTPRLELTKTVTSDGPYELDDTVTYSLVATNAGNTTLHGVTITESNGATLGDCEPTDLAPGERLTCEATWTVTQRAVDAGSHRNTATADSDETAPVSDDATVPVDQRASMELTKRVAEDPEAPEESSAPEEYGLGDVVHYDITLTNTGTVTLTGARITDAGLDAELGQCEPATTASLAPGESLTCTATHTVTQDDVDAAEYTNVASGRSDQVPPVTDSATVKIGQNPELEVTKTVTSVGPYEVGDTITFDVVLENSGDTTLTGVTLEELTADATLGECVPAQPAALAPGAELRCSASHVVTQDDIDQGVYVNVARGDSDQTGPDEDQVEVDIDQRHRLELTKTVTSEGPYVLGSLVTYALVATNDGNTTLNNVRITESEGAVLGECDPGAAGVSIAPGAALRCEASYEVTQRDVDAGRHENTATADSDETAPVDARAEVVVHQDPRLEIVKSIATDPAPPEDGYERGDTIHYSIVVTNSGTVTLTDVTVADPNADGFAAARDCDRDVPAATLPPGGRITCTAEHEVTQGDVDAGSFTNVATTTSGETPDASDDEVVLFTPTPLLRLAKTVTSTGPYELGDTVTYSLVATNAGNVTLHGVSITESEGAVLGRCIPAAPATLAPEGQLVCEASHVVTQDDVDAGVHENTATADSDETDPVDADADVSVYRNPLLEVTKSVVGDGPYEVGDTMTFSILVSNAGTTTLTGVTVAERVDDALLGECSTPLPATLLVGASLTCSATHVVDQSDLDAGHYANTARGDADQVDPDDGDVDVPIDQRPALELTKTVTSDGPYELGDTVTYSLVATNRGNVTVHHVAVDESEGATLGDCTPSQADDTSVSLAPGASMTCAATYEVEQSDVDAGTHTNTATARSTETPKVEADATVPVEQDPELSVTKRVTSEGPYEVGDDLTFEIVTRNSGTVTLTGVTVTELTDGAQLIACTPTTPAELAPGERVVCDAVHELAQADLDAGSFTNVAQGDSDQTPPSTGDDTVRLDQRPRLDLTKTVTSDGPYEPGDTVTYELVATNRGNVTLDDVSITESNGAVLGACEPTGDAVSLAPGASLTCDASYVVEQSDVDAGTHANTATADSQQTDPVDAEATVTVYRNPQLDITKTVVGDGPFVRGDTIEYSILVTNGGNTTLTDVVVTDDDADGFDPAACSPAAPVGTLAVGDTIICTARHLVTQSDVNRGTFSNTATADSEQTDRVESTVVTPFGRTPLLELVKTVTNDGPYELGDTVTYSLVATNRGTVTLDDVRIIESEGAELGDCTPAPEREGEDGGVSLDPGEALTCTATHVVTQRDVNAGTHTNTATADSEQTDPVDAEADVTVYRNPVLELTKTVTSSGPYDRGDVVTYSLVATNGGNTTLTDVSITESNGADLGDCEPTGDTVTLEPGDQLICEARYEVTQRDVDAGAHTNTATADSEQTDPVDADAEVTVFRNAELGIEKSVKGDGPFEVDDTVEFEIVVTNLGNTTLTDVTVAELTDDASLGECEPTLPATLAPEATITCSATHVVTQADVDAGSYTNTAGADSEQTEQVTDDAEVTFDQSSELTLEKTVTSEGPYALGDTVTYSLVATNDGNVTLQGVSIAESEGAELGECDAEQPATLAPGAALSCEATHVVTQDDVDAGEHENTATADSEQTDPVDDSATVEIEAERGLEITKTVTSEGPYSLGDPITFRVVATNSGTTTLTGVTVAEVNDDAELTGCEPTVPTRLAPGATITCTATHLVTQGDFDAGSYRNVAVVDSEQTDPVTDDEVVDTPDPSVDLAITKRQLGDLVTGRRGTYELVVTNHGPATATSIVVTDLVPVGLQLVSASGKGWDCTTAGNDVRCTATSSLRAGEDLAPVEIVVDVVASGSETVVNTGIVGGDQPDRDPSNNQSTVTSPISEVGGNSVDPAPAPPKPADDTQVGGIQKLIDRLPFTGGSLLFGGFGAALLATGMVLFFVSRRRREED